MLRIQ
jgi:uncharacterized protein with GYD domain